MPEDISYFDRVAGIGSRMLDVIGGTARDRKTEEYLARLAEVYDLMGQIHEHVLDVVLDVDVARTHAEAGAALERLQALGLRQVMKAQELCDELGRLGHELQGIEQLSGPDAAAWQEFRTHLEQREGGTSLLYDSRLYDLRTLAQREPDLAALKQKVKEAAHALVVQKAEFELLAKRARKELGRP